MKREDLLKSAMGKEAGSIEVKLSEIREEDEKYINRQLQSYQNNLEDAESGLKKRLKSELPIDDAVVFVQYTAIKEMKGQIALLKEFKEKFL